MDSSDHHPLAVQLDGRTSYLIWTGGQDADRVLAKGDVAVTFRDLDEMRQNALAQQLLLAVRKVDDERQLVEAVPHQRDGVLT